MVFIHIEMVITRRDPDARFFVHKPPQPPRLPEKAWINPPAENTTRQQAPGSTISTLDDIWIPPDPAPQVSVPPEPGIIEAAH